MVKKALLLVAAVLLFTDVLPQGYVTTTENLAARREPQDMKFGMFIQCNFLLNTGPGLEECFDEEEIGN